MALREELERQGQWLFRWRSYLPLLLLPILLLALKESEFPHALWELSCVMVAFVGFVIRCITVGYVAKGTSGRTTQGPKAGMLNIMGMYSIVRHPLYLGNFIMILGIAAFIKVWWFLLVVILAFGLYYERIMFAEEEFLKKKFGRVFDDWALNTPPFIPKLMNWKKPTLLLSLKTILKREYHGFFAIIASFTLLDMGRDLFVEGKLKLERGWAIVFLVGLVLFITLMVLSRKTGILDEKDR